MGARENALDSTRGWGLVGIGFLSQVFIWGTVFSFTVYSDALANEFGLSLVSVSTLYSVELFSFFMIGGLTGILVNNIKIRRSVIGLLIVASAILLWFQTLMSYWGVLAFFVVFGTIFGALFNIILSVVPLWFDQYQSFATGVLLAGNGVGLLVMPRVWNWLLEQFGVRVAFEVIGFTAITVILIFGLVASKPDSESGTQDFFEVTSYVKQKLTERAFWLAFFGFGLIWVWFFALSSFSVNYLIDSGVSRATASSIYGLIGGVSIVSRIAIGGIADRVGQRKIMGLSIGMVTLALLMIEPVGFVITYYVIFGVLGMGLGGIGALYPSIIIDKYGASNSTAMLGVFHSSEAIVGLVSPVLVGFLITISGGYAAPLLIAVILTGVGGSLFLWGTIE